MHLAAFEPTMTGNERLQTNALDRAAFGISTKWSTPVSDADGKIVIVDIKLGWL
jgi:hypothetical protein